MGVQVSSPSLAHFHTQHYKWNPLQLTLILYERFVSDTNPGKTLADAETRLKEIWGTETSEQPTGHDLLQWEYVAVRTLGNHGVASPVRCV